MGKLKLQMQVSADGFVAPEKSQIRFNWNKEVMEYSVANVANVDFILLGRKTAEGFIPHWKSVGENPQAVDHEYGQRATEIPKIAFSRTLRKAEWPNATVDNGELVGSVNRIKRQTGQDLIVYGGAGFVSALIEHDLIDEYHLLANPMVFGKGQAVFARLADTRRLTLVTSRAFSCGTVLLRYKPRD